VDKVLLEYIWLDGHKAPNLRSKTKVVDSSEIAFSTGGTPDVRCLSNWNFDGSSTNQAPGNDSEMQLRPCRVYKWDTNHFFVLSEVYNNDGTPHKSCSRAKLRDSFSKFTAEEFWWGFEQEYFITNGYRPLGFPPEGYPQPQGFYYCGVGENQVVGRKLVERHLDKCLRMGIELTGTNAEVALGQWEYQCFSKDTIKACDDLWISRYVLYRMAEDYGWGIDLTPKPIHGDWNGSGCHTNFSTAWMRNGTRGRDGFKALMDKMEHNHFNHIKNYGEGNESRLTGAHETQHIKNFTWGVGDRGASIRIPNSVEQNGWKGYIEDRRPASNCDPYAVAKLIVETTVDEDMGYYEVEWTD
jgi:glutamine synthetase